MGWQLSMQGMCAGLLVSAWPVQPSVFKDVAQDLRSRKRGGLLLHTCKPHFDSRAVPLPVVPLPATQSAAVLGLSRLVFEFAGQLEGVVGRLLPAVLLLLRSHSREVIKAVLGFIKVGESWWSLFAAGNLHCSCGRVPFMQRARGLHCALRVLTCA